MRKRLVTPYAGVWIEISIKALAAYTGIVTPYAGVWIEINNYEAIDCSIRSLPTRECGLKCIPAFAFCHCISHSLRGSVD